MRYKIIHFFTLLLTVYYKISYPVNIYSYTNLLFKIIYYLYTNLKKFKHKNENNSQTHFPATGVVRVS